MTSMQIAVLFLSAAFLYVVEANYCDCGHYCPDPVKKWHAPLICPAGSYCPRSAYNATSFPTPCPAGSYCAQGVCSPTACPCGYKCPPKSSAAIKCQSPFYCPGTKNSVQKICPIGYKCDQAGMCNATKCLPGTYVSCAGKKSCNACRRAPRAATAPRRRRRSCARRGSSVRRGRLHHSRARRASRARWGRTRHGDDKTNQAVLLSKCAPAC